MVVKDIDVERAKLLREEAVKKSILDVKANDGEKGVIDVPKYILNQSDHTIMRKQSRVVSRFVFVLPGRFETRPSTVEELGELVNLDTPNPVLYIAYPSGRLKLFGTIVRPSHQYFAIHLPYKRAASFAGDFSSIIVFAKYQWIGTRKENPTEKALVFPHSLFPEESSLSSLPCASELDHADIWSRRNNAADDTTGSDKHLPTKTLNTSRRKRRFESLRDDDEDEDETMITSKQIPSTHSSSSINETSSDGIHRPQKKLSRKKNHTPKKSTCSDMSSNSVPLNNVSSNNVSSAKTIGKEQGKADDTNENEASSIVLDLTVSSDVEPERTDDDETTITLQEELSNVDNEISALFDDE